MTRIRALTITSLSVAALAAMGVSALSYTPTTAQVRAEHLCEQHGVRPGSAAWELCLSHVTRAYEWGEFSLAGQLAHAAGQADEICAGRGMRPQTASYRSCINREIEGQSELLVLGDDRTGANLAYTPSDQIAEQ